MIPSPAPVGWDAEPAASISAACDGWPAPRELSSQIGRLLPRAAGYWRAADQLIGLLRTVPLAEQARTACRGFIRSSQAAAGCPAWARG